jgi:hypothetical protein
MASEWITMRATETVGQLMLLQTRTRTLDGTLHNLFTSWYPTVPANDVQPTPLAAQPELPHGFCCSQATVHHVTGRGALPGRWYAEGGSVSQAPSFVSWLLLTVASLPEEGLSEELIDRAQSGL